MKKLLIFAGVIIALFAALAIVTTVSNKEKAEGNPYKKDTLDPATVKQLDDPLYKNIILPDELKKKLDNKESATIYFYSPTCEHCQRTSPVVVPMAEDMGLDLELYNLLEFEQGWQEYNIEATPTIVQFKNGKEVKRIVGYNEPAAFTDWFTKNAVKK